MSWDPVRWKTRWPNFSPTEVLSPECLTRYPHKLCPHSLDNLQRWRRILGVPLVCNFGHHRLRGVRSTRENERIGGALNSMHMAGRAFDLSAKGLPVVELYEKAIKSGFWGGVGIYDSFVHVDTRFNLDGGVVTWDKR